MASFEYFFARRISFATQRAVSGLVVKLAVISIAVAIATIEISLSVVQAFEWRIQEKIIGFASHVQIQPFGHQLNKEDSFLIKEQSVLDTLMGIDEVVAVSSFIEYVAFCNTDASTEGVVLKGVDSTYHWGDFESYMLEGEIPSFAGSGRESLEVLISSKQAQLFKLEVGDRARLLFWEGEDKSPRQRPVTVKGIYETGMEELDARMMICDQRMLQRILRWPSAQVSGFEVHLTSLDELETATNTINDTTPFNFLATPITNIYPEIFDWLGLQHQNVWFILILMMIVAVINMSTVILILIIERTKTVGILKAMGLSSRRIRNMFVWNAFFLILLGLIIGNIMGLGLIWSQDTFGWLKLDQQNYFVKMVPVAWVWSRFIWANLAIVFFCLIFMLLPTLIVNRISPVQAIRFS